MINYAITVILFAIAEVFRAQMEVIKDNKDNSWFPRAPWWTGSAIEYKSKIVNWLVHQSFSFCRDGWHFCKSLSITIYLIAFVVATGQGWYWVVIYYTIIGTVFNIGYNYKELIKHLSYYE